MKIVKNIGIIVGVLIGVLTIISIPVSAVWYLSKDLRAIEVSITKVDGRLNTIEEKIDTNKAPSKRTRSFLQHSSHKKNQHSS